MRTGKLNVYDEATALKMTNKLKDKASLDSQSKGNTNCWIFDTRNENI
jgi:hypothetical protein